MSEYHVSIDNVTDSPIAVGRGARAIKDSKVTSSRKVLLHEMSEEVDRLITLIAANQDLLPAARQAHDCATQAQSELRNKKPRLQLVRRAVREVGPFVAGVDVLADAVSKILSLLARA